MRFTIIIGFVVGEQLKVEVALKLAFPLNVIAVFPSGTAPIFKAPLLLDV